MSVGKDALITLLRSVPAKETGNAKLTFLSLALHSSLPHVQQGSIWSLSRSPSVPLVDLGVDADSAMLDLCARGLVRCDAHSLIAAASAGFFYTVRFLIEERDVSPSALDSAALCLAAENGHLAIVEYLVDLPSEWGVDPGGDCNYALANASENGHTDVVKVLLDLPPERGVDPNDDVIIFMNTVAAGHADIVKLFLDLPPERSVDIHTDDDYVLHSSATCGRADIVKLLLDLPADRRPGPAAIKELLSTEKLAKDVSTLLKKHLAETEPARKRRRTRHTSK